MKKLAFLLIVVALVSCSKDKDDEGIVKDGWNITVVDDVNAAGNDISVAIDGNNKLHICYTDDSDLKYANNKSGSWSKETLVSAAGIVMILMYNDIAVDDNGNVHILYATVTNELNTHSIVYYATNVTGTMVKIPVYEVDGSISGMGIAATSDGKVHIVLSDEDFRLNHLTNIGGSMFYQDMFSYWTSVRPRIALDVNENAYVAYEHGGEGVLRMQVINTAGELVSNYVVDGVVNSGDKTGWSPDIAVNANATYIIYYDYSAEEMMFYNNGSIFPIESSNLADGNVAIDPEGTPHILFSNHRALRYGELSSGSFTLVDLPDETNSRTNGMAIGSDGKVYIVYSSGTTYDLRLMTK